ncbi:MAG: 4-alpha-glucanotransferase [Actinomycetota bacterium]
MTPNAEAWGIQPRYHEAGGRERVASAETVEALLRAMRAADDAPPASAVISARVGETRPLPGAAEVVTEDGSVVAADGDTLPPGLPLGYHRVEWRASGAPPARLIVAPQRCYLPEGLRTWGWAVQLYALRSGASWGFGDLGDLRRLIRWSRSLGAGMTLLNPLHAVSPGTPQQASPYYPGSRLWRNPLYIHVEDVPGAAGAGLDLERLAAAGRVLNDRAGIERDGVYDLKMEALGLLWRRGGTRADPRFRRYLDAHGSLLEGFATFAALVERHGRAPAKWPPELRHPDSPAVAGFRSERSDRIRFHSWLQWLLDLQLAEAASPGGLVQDLAIGVDPAGADAWLWQDLFAVGARVGAPPDVFNSQGQDWGALAFDPWRLRDAGYEPFIRTVRWSLARGGGLRFDHVMGLWRLFWIPDGAPPSEGTYVRYPTADLLDILALESVRAEAYIVGEDLGTVEPVVRAEMAARDMLSYRLLWFEPGPAAEYPSEALAAVTNHDLPTVAGLWTGSDLQAQRELGLQPDEEAHAALRRHLAELTGLGDEAPIEDVVAATYGLLAGAPCALLAATLEDALALSERQNHPGTTDEWPNWSLPLPVPLEELEEHPGTRRLAAILGR